MADPIKIEVIAEIDKLNKGIETANTQLGSIEKAASSLGPHLKGALAFDLLEKGASKFADMVGEAVQTVQEQGRLAAQTEAVIKSTGGAAGVTADEIKTLSDAIEANSVIEAESAQAGMNMLATFTNVKNGVGEGNDVFTQASKTMADMATAMDMDMTQAATMMGKALNDPIAGVGALSRVGVQFTDVQKDQIKAMVEAGDVMGAQKVILGELGTQFGGSAEAAAGTWEGAMFQISNVIDGAIEGVITDAAPKLTEFAQALAEWLPGALETLKTRIAEIKERMQPFLDAIAAFIGFLKDSPETVKAFAITLGILGTAIGVVAAAQALWNLMMTLNPIGLIIVAIGLLVAAVVWLVTNWEDVTARIGAALGRFGDWVKGGFESAGNKIGEFWDRATAWFSALPGRAGDAARDMADRVTQWAGSMRDQAVDRIRSLVDGAINLLRSLPGQAGDAMSNMVTSMMWWVNSLPGQITGALSGLGSILWNAGSSIIQGFLNGIRAKFEAVKNFVWGIGDWIANNKGPISYDLRLLIPNGDAIMTSLVRGLDQAMPKLRDQLADITTTIADTQANLDADVTLNTNTPTGSARSGISINITAPPFTDPVEIGRQVKKALAAYERVIA